MVKRLQLRLVGRRGFTLLEVIVASSLVLLVAMAVLSIYVTTQRFYRSTISQIDLQNEASFAMEHMVERTRWGYDAAISGGDEVVDVDVDDADPPTVPATTPVTIRYEKSDSTLRYTPDITSPGTFETIVQGVNSLEFSLTTDVETGLKTLTITLSIENEDGSQGVSLNSAVTLRYSAI